MHTDGFEVVPYSSANLIRVVSKYTPSSSFALDNKYHLQFYFPEYLNKLKVKTIAVETEYIDRDYLEDYSGFYVRCFDPPKRNCTRVHFFNVDFKEDDFKKALSGDNDSLIEKIKEPEAYIGFVVLKPLPETIIGRTCIRTYPKNGRRIFSATRDYHANLFGIDLKVHTLAFQEQDKVAAACATSALWTVFNGTGILFQHQMLSPLEITNKAIQNMPYEVRIVPNEGLNLFHMTNAIRQINLEPLLFQLNTINDLKRAVRAYVDFGLPLLLLLGIRDKRGSGLHAVAITGYSMPKTNEVDFYAEHIDKLYVHDDQIGPFARMVFRSSESTIEFEDESVMTGPSFDTSWPNSDVVAGNLIVPVYHKTRITHEPIFDLISRFEASLEILEKVEWTWDIRLTAINKLKEEILQSSRIHGDYKCEILSQKMPRFLWKATAYTKNNDQIILDLLFDATDIEQDQFFIRAIEYDPHLADVCRSLSSKIQESEKDAYKGIIEWFS